MIVFYYICGEEFFHQIVSKIKKLQLQITTFLFSQHLCTLTISRNYNMPWCDLVGVDEEVVGREAV